MSKMKEQRLTVDATDGICSLVNHSIQKANSVLLIYLLLDGDQQQFLELKANNVLVRKEDYRTPYLY